MTTTLDHAATTTQPLVGRRALVTGAGTGIGAATARAIAAAGGRVALLGRRANKVESLAAELTTEGAGAAVAVPADVTDAGSLIAAVDAAREQLGGTIDLSVVNAGAMLAAPFERADVAEWRRMIDVNLVGLLSTARATIDDLLTTAAERRPADLVLVSSIGARLAIPGYAVYTATKAAVTHLGTNLRNEFGPRGIRVHVVEPGMTASDLGRDMADAEARDWLEQFKQEYPPIPAESIAAGIVWSAALPADVNVAGLVIQPTVQP